MPAANSTSINTQKLDESRIEALRPRAIGFNDEGGGSSGGTATTFGLSSGCRGGGGNTPAFGAGGSSRIAIGFRL